MQGSDLTVKQLMDLRNAIRPNADYLTKLKTRMEAMEFPKHDRLYRSASQAHERMKELLMEIETLLSYRGYSSTPEAFR